LYSVTAYDTVVTKQQHRDLQAISFNLYYFTCGKEVYKCGKGKIDPTYACPAATGATPAKGKITAKQCNALMAESRKDNAITQLYSKTIKLCPNGKNVVSYMKYTTAGAGRFCKPKKACICCHNGEVGGDPHFLTYDGTPYSYHGQCDLVMARSKEFANGLGLNVHARTEIIEGTWSLISQAAVKIGDDILEMTNQGDIYYNGNKIEDFERDLPTALSGSYNITRIVNYIGNDKIPKTDLNIILYEGEKNKIRLSLFKRLLAVHVGATEEDLSGMLGHRLYDGLIGRDGVSMMDGPNEMGQEWQVRGDEPMLFHDIKAPQFPQQCMIPDATSRRRLRKDTVQHRRRAEESCADVKDARKKQFCLEDMILLGDVHVAEMYRHVENEQ
jgi:von Willebrand factor type D domain